MKKILLTVLFLLVIAGCVGPAQSSPETSTSENISEETTESPGLPSWQTAEMTDVLTNQSFSVNSLSKPVLVESFAIWCPPCTRQQQEIKRLKNMRNITSVSVNVDPEEDVRVRDHATSNDFDWRYVTAPKPTTSKFVEVFGRTFISPPSVPVILVCDDKNYELLDRGVMTVSQLDETVAATCAA